MQIFIEVHLPGGGGWGVDSHVKVMGMLVVLLRGVHCRFWSRLGCLRCHSGIAYRVRTFFEQKLQGLYKDFQGQISHFSRTPFSAKKRFESMSFLVLPQHEQFYPEGLSY